MFLNEPTLVVAGAEKERKSSDRRIFGSVDWGQGRLFVQLTTEGYSRDLIHGSNEEEITERRTEESQREPSKGKAYNTHTRTTQRSDVTTSNELIRNSGTSNADDRIKAAVKQFNGCHLLAEDKEK